MSLARPFTPVTATASAPDEGTMSTRAFSQTCQLVRALLREFEVAREPELSDQGRRNLIEAVELLRLFFDEIGLHVVDLRQDAPARLLEGVSSIDGVCGYLEVLGDPFLGRVLPAEREFSKVVLAVARDFARWLRGRSMPVLVSAQRQGHAL